MDSILHYIDQAGGIDPDRGSFLDIEVKRGSTVRAKLNLYDFLLRGEMPQIKLSAGDVILVGPRERPIKVSGLAANAKRFEFYGGQVPLNELHALATPLALATHARGNRNTGILRTDMERATWRVR